MQRPLRIAFDNNFINKFDEAPAHTQHAVLHCVNADRIVVYASVLMLRELMGMAGTASDARLPQFARHVLALTRGRILADPQTILESELNGRAEIELEPVQCAHLVQYLTRTANGQIQRSAQQIGREAFAEKQEALAELRKHKPILEDRPAGMTDAAWKSLKSSRKALRKRITFEQIREMWSSKHARALLEMNYSQWRLADPGDLADRVLGALESYPRHAAWIATHALPAYWLRTLGEAPDLGDLFDHRQLVYGYDLDVFITDDSRLRKWLEAVYGSDLRVMSADEFFAHKSC